MRMNVWKIVRNSNTVSISHHFVLCLSRKTTAVVTCDTHTSTARGRKPQFLFNTPPLLYKQGNRFSHKQVSDHSNHASTKFILYLSYFPPTGRNNLSCPAQCGYHHKSIKGEFNLQAAEQIAGPVVGRWVFPI
jgi:hypothetical protein